MANTYTWLHYHLILSPKNRVGLIWHAIQQAINDSTVPMGRGMSPTHLQAINDLPKLKPSRWDEEDRSSYFPFSFATLESTPIGEKLSVKSRDGKESWFLANRRRRKERMPSETVIYFWRQMKHANFSASNQYRER